MYLETSPTEEELILENGISNRNGYVIVSLTKRGTYRVEVSVDDYLTQNVFRSISQDTRTCTKFIQVSLVQKILVSLSWGEAPKNLDIRVVRSNFSSACQDGCGMGKFSDQCATTATALQCKAGSSSSRGEEVVALSDPSEQRGAVYTVSVRLATNTGTSQQFAASRARVTVQDGLQTRTADLAEANFVGGSVTWVVGCLWVLDEASDSGSWFRWSQLDTFSEKGPLAIDRNLCMNHIESLRQMEGGASQETVPAPARTDSLSVELCAPILGVALAWQLRLLQEAQARGDEVFSRELDSQVVSHKGYQLTGTR